MSCHKMKSLVAIKGWNESTDITLKDGYEILVNEKINLENHGCMVSA